MSVEYLPDIIYVCCLSFVPAWQVGMTLVDSVYVRQVMFGVEWWAV